jgi:phosphotransferase system  glucose/maltose/N-acetylglucosamine-specific IIC component
MKDILSKIFQLALALVIVGVLLPMIWPASEKYIPDLLVRWSHAVEGFLRTVANGIGELFK